MNLPGTSNSVEMIHFVGPLRVLVFKVFVKVGDDGFHRFFDFDVFLKIMPSDHLLQFANLQAGTESIKN
jgi:hypothetical protein